MPTAESPPEPPVRREVIELIRRLDLFGTHPDSAGAHAADLSPGDRELLATANEREKHVAALEVLRELARAGIRVETPDGAVADLSDDPDWA
jgi:hypothetical protein